MAQIGNKMEDNCIKLDRFFISKLFPKREQDSNKSTFGTVLNFAGSIYYTGAAYLSSISALRVGCGLVRLAAATNVMTVVAGLTPDVTFVDLGQNDFGTIPKDALKYVKPLREPSAIAVGCGLTNFPPVKEFVLKLLKCYINSPTPVVIDADGLNILSSVNKPLLPLNSVITPHEKELSRLLKLDPEEIKKDRILYAKKACEQFDCIVVLKGKQTVISIPGGCTYINTTGSSALAHAGSGDVLCGMIAGFAAQNMKLEDAALLSVYLHGRAGELASKKLSEYSVLASDLLEYIPLAIKEFIPS